jgi:UPF0755 protein
LTNAKAIEAALHPLDDGSLYFVASGNGRHTFSSNYKDHLKAVNLYQKRSRRKSPAKKSSGN